MLYLFDSFEVDEQNFSLRRDGQRVPIEPRALQVLIVLVGNKGRLLEKRELLDSVWKETFVEESTLTRAIAILRKLLQDDPKAPRYIETVPTRGYRFIAEIEVVTRETSPYPADEPPLQEPLTVLLLEAAAHDEVTAPEHSIPAPKSRFRLYVASVAIAALVTGGLFATRAFRARPRPSAQGDVTVVLANFANTTADPVFDETLRQGVMVQLEQSPVLRLVSDGQIQKTLRLMTKSSATPITPELSRELCQRVNGGVVLDGSVSRLGSEYVLGLRARSCSTGEELDMEQVQFSRKEDALASLSQIANKLRARLGEPGSSIKNHDTPLAEATTPSLEALRAFSHALKVFNSSGSGNAIPLFKEATELDPQFAMAYVWLGRMYADFDEESPAIESTRKAYELRARASDRERFSIDVSYDLIVTGNLTRAKETCEAWKQMYPRDTYPRAFLSGIILPAFGQYEAGLEEGRKTVEIDPDFVLGYRNMVFNAVALNRLQDAESALQSAATRKLFLPGFITDSYRIAYLKGDSEGMKRAMIAAPTNPWLITYEANALSDQGHLAAAREMSVRAISLARKTSRHDTEAQLELAAATREAFYGDPHLAADQAREANKLSSVKGVEYGAAFVLALTKNSAEAAKLTADLASRFPDDTVVQSDYVPTLQALLALNQNQPDKAFELLKFTKPYELSQPLHPIYLRGQALLTTGRASEAAVEFEKISSHPGIVLNDPLALMARLQLCRAYALMGEKAKARSAYDALLKSWNSADSVFPLKAQVLREYAKL